MATITRTLTLSGMSMTSLGVAPTITAQGQAVTTTTPNVRLDFNLAADAPERFVGPGTISFIAQPSDGDLGPLALGDEWTVTVTVAPASSSASSTTAPAASSSAASSGSSSATSSGS